MFNVRKEKGKSEGEKVTDPLDIRRWHQGAEDGEIFIHLFAAVALNSNVGHPLVLDVLFVPAALRAPSLAAACGGRRRWVN